jgi:hypothetical protein
MTKISICTCLQEAAALKALRTRRPSSPHGVISIHQTFHLAAAVHAEQDGGIQIGRRFQPSGSVVLPV